LPDGRAVPGSRKKRFGVRGITARRMLSLGDDGRGGENLAVENLLAVIRQLAFD